MSWKTLGSGSFNKTYISDDRKFVLKIQKNFSETDTPERSIRLWNEINADINPQAYVIESEFGKGWVCPFIKGKQANDREMSKALIDIFNRTGRIIVDAISPKNFIRTDEGQIVCIDIGMAMQLEKRERELFTNISRKSVVSLEMWESMKSIYNDYYWTNSWTYPQTVNTCKALLFIKSNRPDIFDVNFLKNQPNIVKIVSRAYDAQKEEHLAKVILEQSTKNKKIPTVSLKTKDVLSEAQRKGKEVLLEQREISIDNLKESCMKELTRYLLSRGSIKEGEFSASFRTRFFRDTTLTLIKAEYVKLLMNQINDAVDINDIKKCLEQAQQDEVLTQSSHTSGLASSLGKCMIMVDFVKRNQLDNKLSSLQFTKD